MFHEEHCQLSSQSIAPVLFLGTAIILESAAKLLNVYSTSYCITKNVKKMYTHSSRFNTINNDKI